MHAPHRPIVDEHRELRLAEQVDEAGCDHGATDVDAAARRRLGQIADGDDAIAGDADVSAEPGGAGAVDDSPSGEHQVEDDRQHRYQGASKDKRESASATVAGSRPTSRAMRTAFSTNSPFDLAI